MGLVLALEIRGTAPDQGLQDDERGAIDLAARGLEGDRETASVLTIDRVDDMPAVGAKTGGHALTKRDLGAAVDRDRVVVVEIDEVAEGVSTGEGRGLRGHAFHQIAVADEAVDEMLPGKVPVRRARGIASELRTRHARREGHADAVGEALAEGTGRELDTGRLPVLGVARRARSELAEP